jgi:hypothetical protein
VEAHSVPSGVGEGFAPVTDAPAGGAAGGLRDGAYGYLMTPGFDAMPALVDFLQAGGRAYAQPDTFRLEGTLYPQGTLFLPRGRNAELEEKIRQAGLGSFMVPVSTGLTETGLDLGTGSAGFVTLPKVAVLGGEGGGGGFGTHWFFMERVLGLPFDALTFNALTAENLVDYDVLVFPEGASRMSEAQAGAVEGWVRGGGTLVAVGGSAQSLGRSMAELEMRTEDEEELEDQERIARALRTRAERRSDRWERSVPGSILKVQMDTGHFLTAGAGAGGLEGEMFVLTRGRGFEPSEDFSSAVFFGEDLQKISGVISQRNLDRMSQSTWLADVGVGRGRLILFVEDPLFRMFWYSGYQLYANAVLMGPAF